MDPDTINSMILHFHADKKIPSRAILRRTSVRARYGSKKIPVIVSNRAAHSTNGRGGNNDPKCLGFGFFDQDFRRSISPTVFSSLAPKNFSWSYFPKGEERVSGRESGRAKGVREQVCV